MSNFERKVPVFKTSTSVIDNEFNSIRERFDDDIRRMENEMAAFRQKMLEKENEWFKSRGIPELNHSTFNSTTSQQQTSTSSSLQEQKHSSNLTERHSSNQFGSWLNGLESPLVQDTSDGKALKLRFDVTEYAPEEIVVKTVDNKLQVNARHEEVSETRNVLKEYKREFLLPKGVNPELIRSSLSKDGVLTVEAPLPAIEDNRERQIPIGHR